MGKDSAERVLTTRELNRALLARQLLLERSKLPLTRALECVAGLQAQYAPAGYISLWSRVDGFERDQLTRALEQRRVIQGTLLRATIHMVWAGDYPLFLAGIRRFRQEWWQRVQAKPLEGVDMKKVASLLRRRLRKGPRRQAELMEILAAEGFPRVAWSGAGLWLDLVRVPPPEPGSDAEPTSTPWPISGCRDDAGSPKRRGCVISSAGTSAGSVRLGRTMWPAGPGCPWGLSDPWPRR